MGKQSNIMLLIVMYGSAFLAGFNENLMNMGLMAMMSEYGVDSITAQWTVTGYMIVATIVVTAMAFLYRRFKLRLLFFVGALFAVLGSALGLFATSFEMLMAARLLQAFGAGMFIPMMMNTILLVVPKNRLGSYMAIGGCMISFGPAFAPVVCGFLVTSIGWHSVFMVPLVGMIVIVLIGIVSVRNFDNDAAHLDVLSLLLSAVLLFTLSFGLSQLSVNLFAGSISLGVAVLSAVFFVIRQGKVEYPLIDLRPMSRSTFWPATLLVFVAMLITFSLSVLLPLYFEGSLGMSALFAGLVILVPVLANCGATIVGGRIMDAKGEWPLLPAGFLLMVIGVAGMAVVSVAMSVPLMFVAALVAYAGVGLVFSPSQTAGLRTLPPRENPFGVAIMTTMTQIAACIGPSLFVGVMSGSQAGSLAAGASSESATATGFSAAIFVAFVFAVIGFIAALLFAFKAKQASESGETGRAQEDEGPLSRISLSSLVDPNPVLFSATDPVFVAMRTMVENGIEGAPVVDDEDKLAGYLSDGDIMRFLAEKHPTFTTSYSFVEAANNQTIDERMKELMDLPVNRICTENAVTLPMNASLKRACNLLSQKRIKNVPLVDEGGRVVASLNRARFLRATMEVYLDQKNLAR